jgi:hypothetical protein
MWVCYRQSARIFGTYARGEQSTKALAEELGVTVESVRNWALAGMLRSALRGMTGIDETGKIWTVLDLRQALTLAHWQVAGKALRREAAGPDEIFEWLTICASDAKSAEWLGAQLMPPAPGSLFQSRFVTLFNSDLPAEWPEGRKDLVTAWLKEGKAIMEGPCE